MTGRVRRLAAATVACAALMLVASAPAGAKDYARDAFNILPHGQYGSFPAPEGADEQALMYDGLTPLFDEVGRRDLERYFKSEGFGVGPDGPFTKEDLPRGDVNIYRDRFNVPHIYSKRARAGIWAAGWITAQDRGLLLQQARYNARVAAIDAPHLSAIGLVQNLANFQPSERTEAEVAKQARALRQEGREGRAVLTDIDQFIEGINDYLEHTGSSNEPWTRNDVFAVNALKGQFLGQGGGDEARRSQFLGSLQTRLGDKAGMRIFNDLRQFKNPDAPVSIDGHHPYGHIPKRARGSIVLDPGSYEAAPAVQDRELQRMAAPEPFNASNVLMITKERSTNGLPLMVGGPQIGYNYPGLTGEMDMHAGRLQWRGATSAPFPGYLLIGRGEDFSITLTSASADIIDEFALRTCGGSATKYRHNGRCKDMGTFDAGTLNGEPVVFNTTAQGPVVGYGTAKGKRYAIAQKRSSYGEDATDLLFNRRISNGAVDSVRSFYKAASKTPQTFNSFYIDHRNVAMYTSGKLPVRHPKADPGLLTKGNGRFDWRGFLPAGDHPQGKNPKDGTLTNWNNNAARGFAAADDQFGRSGSSARVNLLDKNLKRLANGQGKWNLQRVTAAMNAGATQDIRAIDTVPLLAKLLRGSAGPSPRAEQMLRILKQWRKAGGSRLDIDLDGGIDHPGAAIMDEAWPLIADNFMRPRLGPNLDELASLFSRFDLPPSGQYSGWHQYFDRDIRALLGKKVTRPFKVSYCGRGSLRKCRDAIWAAIEAAGDSLAADQGGDPFAWRSDAVRERISFPPGILPTTMRYSNRPSGIQQLISFDGHR